MTVRASMISLSLALLLASACSDGSGDQPEPAEIGVAPGYLAEGRTVSVSPGAEVDTTLPPVDPRELAKGIRWHRSFNEGRDSWLDLVAASCDVQVRSTYKNGKEAYMNGQTPDVHPGLAATGIFSQVPTSDENVVRVSSDYSPLGRWSSTYSLDPYVTQAALLCAGQRALEIAVSLSPTYFLGRPLASSPDRVDFIVATQNPAEWPRPWLMHQDLLRRSLTNTAWALPDIKTFKPLFVIPSPNASEAATWSLLAVDFFREAALLGTSALRSYSIDKLGGMARLADGDIVTLEQMILGNLSDAIMGMQDASERAERYVAAAGSARPNGEERNPSQGWRERHDSRLEAARTFAPVPADAFDGHGLVPLVRITAKTVATPVTTEYHETTSPVSEKAKLLAAGRTIDSELTLGYVYSPSLPPPAGAVALQRHARVVNQAVLDEILVPEGTNVAGYVLSLEGPAAATVGYVPAQSLPAGTGFGLGYTTVGSGAATKKYLDAGAATTAMYVFGTKVANSIEPPALAGRYPTVEKAALSLRAQDRIAEQMIRGLRVMPICLGPQHPRCRGDAAIRRVCTCNTPGQPNVASVFQDLMDLERERLDKQTPWQTQEGFLTAYGFTAADVENATLRIVQTAAVLGREIVPMEDSEHSGSASILRAHGTQQDYREVEPVYLQARTDGNARFFTSAPEDDSGYPTAEYARRGMFHAIGYVRRMIELYAPSASLVASRDKLRNYLDALTPGYAFVRVSKTDSATTVFVKERELVASVGAYELWRGEGGLECALTGGISGVNCHPETSPLRLAASGVERVIANGVAQPRTLEVSRSDLNAGDRLYLLKMVGRQRRAMAGLTIPPLDSGRDDKRALPLMSDALASAYRATLAASPSDTYRETQFCNALVDYDMRIKLSDELSQAQGGGQGLSDSVEYYLSRAETAAARSDTLGEEVIRNGLAMDERAEQGQEQLEDLCGAVTGKDGEVYQGATGLQACMQGPGELDWVSVGTKEHCVWSRNDPQLGPCECGSNKPCQEALRTGGINCPILPETSTAALPGETPAQRANRVCAPLFANWMTAGGLNTSDFHYELLTTLNYSADTGANGQSPSTDIPNAASLPPSVPEAWRDSTSRCEMLAALHSGAFASAEIGEIRQALPWLDFDEVRDVAASIGWSMDPYGRVSLTLDGEPWLAVGSFPKGYAPGADGSWEGKDVVASDDRRSWNAYTKWPVAANCTGSALDFTECSGTKRTLGANAGDPQEGGYHDASVVFRGLNVLEMLTGAAGVRDGWKPITSPRDVIRVAVEKRYIDRTEPLAPNTPEWNLFSDPTKSYVYWASKDNGKHRFFVTALSGVEDAALETWYDTYFYYRGKNYSRDPWNWKDAAGFKWTHTDSKVNAKFRGDMFANDGVLWRVLRSDAAGGRYYTDPFGHSSDDTAEAGYYEIFHDGGWAYAPHAERVKRNELFDAFSLVCRALDDREGLKGTVQGCGTFFGAEPSMRDAANAAECIAGEVNGLLDTLYIPGVPPDLIGNLQAHKAQQPLPEYAGEYAESVVNLGAELDVYERTAQATARSLNEISYHVRTIQRTIDTLENQAKITQLELRRDIANQVTACLVALASNGGFDMIKKPGAWGIPAATCANSAAQIAWASKIENLKQENIDLAQQQELDDFQESMQEVLARIDTQIVELKRSHAAVHGYIARMDRIRAQARRARVRATLATDAGQGQVNRVNAVMRARMNTSLARYTQAFRQAVRYGFLARRAIEQRIGMDLGLMTKKMSLSGTDKAGEAPFEWADSICQATGVNYDDVASGKAGEASGFSGTYIGDYVVRLRDFLDAYRHDFPFEQGTDTVVVSMRDELQGVRRLDCPVEGANLLFDTAEPTSAKGAWTCLGASDQCGALLPGVGRGPLVCDGVGDCQLGQTGARPVELQSVLGTPDPNDVNALSRALLPPSENAIVASRLDYLPGTPLYDRAANPANRLPGWSHVGVTGAAGSEMVVNPARMDACDVDGASVACVDAAAGVARVLGTGNAHTVLLTMEASGGSLFSVKQGNDVVASVAYDAASEALTLDGATVRGSNGVRTLDATSGGWLTVVVVIDRSSATDPLRLRVAGREYSLAPTVALRVNTSLSLHLGEGLRFAGATHYASVLSSSALASLVPISAAPGGSLLRRVEQVVDVTPGPYTLSWYERCDAIDARMPMRAFFIDPGADAAEAVTLDPTCSCERMHACDDVLDVPAEPGVPSTTWVRRAIVFDAASEGPGTVGFELMLDSVPTATPGAVVPRAVLAAPQLEEGELASPFFATRESLRAPVGICEDTDGRNFRSWDNWVYRCEVYCSPGMGLDCERRFPESSLNRACFYETKFHISQEEVERGLLISEAGFSKGNFNYRMGELALNLVGTGLRSCENAELPSACNAGQFLQYSIDHVGPYRVRNHQGNLYDARLYTGHIQQAKGLTAERYITNPISDADEKLLGSYWHSELRGRPLEGTYFVRVYDTPALQWQQLQDIQLVMRYHYWTRAQ